jgi:hypothetical protein
MKSSSIAGAVDRKSSLSAMVFHSTAGAVNINSFLRAVQSPDIAGAAMQKQDTSMPSAFISTFVD